MDNLTHTIVNVSHQLAIEFSANRVTLERGAFFLFDYAQNASGGNAELAEELISTLCSRAEEIFSERSDLALPYVTLVLRVAEQFGDPFYCGRATHILGKTLKRYGRFQEAKEAFTASLEYFSPTYPVHAGVATGDIGNILFSLGEYDEAERLLRIALNSARRQEDVHNQLEWKLGLGNVLLFTSKNDDALEILQDGLRQARATCKPYHEGAFLTAIANVYENLGRFDDCVSYHKAALSISTQIGDKVSETYDLLNLGNLQHRFNRLDAAVELYKQSYDLAVQLDHLPLQAQLMGSIAGVFLKQGKVQQAISLQEKELRICREHGLKYQLLRSLGNLGNSYRLTRENEKARACYLESLSLSRETNDLRSLAVDLRSLASITNDLGDTEEALQYAEEALKIAEQLEDPEFISRSEKVLATLLQKIPARHHELWQHYQRAMEASETLRRHVRADQDRIDLYSSYQYSLYEEAVRWLLNNGEVQRAFEISERFKSRLLLDAIAERATGKLSEAESAQQLLDRARTVGHETSIASYFMCTNETILFFIPPGGLTVEHVRLPVGLDACMEWFERWFRLLPGEHASQTPSLATVEKTLEELDAILVKSLRRCLEQHKETKRLLLIPHRFLHSMPIHLARDPETGRYLAEDLTITYLSALRLLKTSEPEQSREDLKLLAIGEPSTTLPALPAALAEAKAVAELFNAKVLTGTEATLKAFVDNARLANIIHLACHCEFNPQKPGRSYLLMAGNEFLTADRISSLQLDKVVLVSMAACESSRARPGGVDESLGLTRSWLISDVRFVLGAQWKVEDRTSKMFMLDFYRRVRDGVSCPEAYSAAQRLIIDRPAPFNDPRLWGPFILTGFA